jgi:hypothetical protein
MRMHLEIFVAVDVKDDEQLRAAAHEVIDRSPFEVPPARR